MARAAAASACPGHDAPTDVVDFTTPPELLAAKARELRAVGPGGLAKLLAYVLVCIPLWLLSGIRALLRYALRPAAMFAAPDPSRFTAGLVPPFPLHEEFIEVNGLKLHAVSPGRRRDKPLMLFLHGFPECWYSWRHQMAAFAEDYDVVAIDQRGYNTSDKPQGVGAYTYQQLAADVKGAVEALGHRSCTLVAHDWGGNVAWLVAGLYGRQLVGRLIVMGLPHIGVGMTNMSGEQYMRSLYMMLFQAPFIPELLIAGDDAAIMERSFRGDLEGVKNQAAITDNDIAWFRAAMCQPGAATATLNWYRAFVRFSVLSSPDDPVWSAIRRPLDMPVLVLHGDSDFALGMQLLDGIEAAVPQGTVKVLKNCSHWVQQDYPGVVNGVMRDWLAAHPVV